MESSNGTLPDECLNTHWFMSLTDAKERIERWRVEYNDRYARIAPLRNWRWTNSGNCINQKPANQLIYEWCIRRGKVTQEWHARGVRCDVGLQSVSHGEFVTDMRIETLPACQAFETFASVAREICPAPSTAVPIPIRPCTRVYRRVSRTRRPIRSRIAGMHHCGVDKTALAATAVHRRAPRGVVTFIGRKTGTATCGLLKEGAGHICDKRRPPSSKISSSLQKLRRIIPVSVPSP